MCILYGHGAFTIENVRFQADYENVVAHHVLFCIVLLGNGAISDWLRTSGEREHVGKSGEGKLTLLVQGIGFRV